MLYKTALVSLSLLAAGCAQQVGIETAETHPGLVWQKCTAKGGCTSQAGSVTLDANWRWLHATSGYTNCYTSNSFNPSLCPDGATCAKNCALDGADYAGTYGIRTSGNSLTLRFVTSGASRNVGSRVYLMADDTHYQVFKLLNQELTFDVDVSRLPCGLNGALYFSEMAADGGMSKEPNNKAGAKYGTGYCDSQCPRDVKFIGGEAGLRSIFIPSPNDPNSGTGNWGACCSEMDIWEANSISTAYTPHPCAATGLTRCSSSSRSCIDKDRYGSACDPDGCDFNSYRMGDKSFYGKGMTVDTNKKMTVVTQFLTDDGTAMGTLSEIRRLYIQDGRVIQNSKINVPGIPTGDSITDAYCASQKSVFGDTNAFAAKGGLAGISKSFANGVVLVMSIWDDYAANMLWLDGNYPPDKSPTLPGVARGTCAAGSGKPADLEVVSPDATVVFSNIKFGDINSTHVVCCGPSPPTTTTGRPTSSTTNSVQNSVTPVKYGQCGGIGWTGPTDCPSGSACVVLNQFYSQCL
ncbi:carbohydrate-binding module family 1 protein [Botryobasidium botryosum FD-172 SS1]|uniref:Glucanase n=1 Tax=Botryobasidium botryosum (strain FD-172 SS1) TaxID=930990 RepID=A0A067MDE9_BOTB1|nr:carbohydrate-binding module family 1 protein [Botryobasidium botryosum FD-172 SS1]